MILRLFTEFVGGMVHSALYVMLINHALPYSLLKLTCSPSGEASVTHAPMNPIIQLSGEAVKGCSIEIVVETYLFRNIYVKVKEG